MCKWHGVVCGLRGNRRGHVVALDLAELNLLGTIAPALGNLSHLIRRLHLPWNRFHGILPLQLCNLQELTHLDLSLNSIGGQIPLSLSNCSCLTVLNVAHNNLNGEIPAEIGKLVNLVTLGLRENNLAGRIPPSMGNISSLTAIDLYKNELVGQIPESLRNLDLLIYLGLDVNNLSGPIPHALGNLRSLEALFLNFNRLEGELPPTIFNLSYLESLVVSNNILNGSLPSDMTSNFPSLKNFSIQFNNFHGMVPSSLCNNSILVDLVITNNFLSGNNKITGTIPEGIGDLVNLEYLSMDQNLLEGSIPTSISKISMLGRLYLQNNKLSGFIPPSLGNLTNLELVALQGNAFGGVIPSTLSSPTLSVSMRISHNLLSGPLPSELGNLQNVAALDFSDNRISGEIPSSIGECQILEYLNISGNVLQEFLGTLRALSSLNLSFNKFEGQVPQDGMFLNATAISIIGDDGLCGGIAELKLPACNIFKKSSYIIGAGSFGSVYKGILISTDQQEVVAVKVLNLSQRGASQSFIAECETLRSIRQRILVRLLTVCSSIDHQGHEFKAIVYEFLPNGNLDKWLHQNFGEHEEPLDLSSRLQIAIDVASSLEYLHQHKPFPIVHCDLKPSNVLLDTDMVAHVSDFGLARFLHQDLRQSNSWVTMRSTIGYAAPEYGLGNEVSIHGDVYSYGILLLEMFTEKRPTDSEFAEGLSLRKYVQMALPESVANILDQNMLQDGWDYDARITTSRSNKDIEISCITSTLRIGISGSADMPADRPRIRDALKELESIRDKLRKDLPLAGVPMSSNARGHGH
ncbi:hypothetical protein HU200_065326 [Digitaria exilis]|uniref:non-specific serine/threonine protein kinase n=1 Tax=Digitaria exilis TaxID=1010633 RepID=A0A835A4C7_9POAL|nr:hypothetical protein HU200_065326 [Digitaria exilis]